MLAPHVLITRACTAAAAKMRQRLYRAQKNGFVSFIVLRTMRSRSPKPR